MLKVLFLALVPSHRHHKLPFSVSFEDSPRSARLPGSTLFIHLHRGTLAAHSLFLSIMFALLPLLPLFSLALSISPSVALNSHRSLNSDVVLKHKRVASNLSNRTLLVGDDPAELVKRDGTKYVFMHHIVGNTYPYTQADWADDIQKISSKGVDALALNIGFDSWQPAQVASAYAAAVGTNFKLFISFDFTEIACDVNSVANWVNQYANHPNQFKINGKPFISSFSGDCLGNAGWANLKAMTNGYVMPFIWGLEGNFNNWPALDSWYCWGCAWPEGNYDKTTADDQYYINQLGTRYATTVSGWMFAHDAGKNFYQRGDDWLINNRWEQIVGMRNQLTFVEMVTWNDYGESDYFGPLKGAPPASTYWAANYPHTPWFDMSAYYIQAFKTGSYPAITQDVIYYWSRPHPKGATASADQFGKPSGWDWSLDFVWAAVFATAPATVTLQVGGNSQTFSVTAGVNKLQLPMTTGQITVTMVRGGQTIISKTDTNLNIISNPTQYNYNAYVGSATATGGGGGGGGATTTTTTSPTTSTTASAPANTFATTTWTSAGCYVDSADRMLRGSSTTQAGMTVEKCTGLCFKQKYRIAALEYGTQCYCGAQMFTTNGAGVKAASTDCNMPCDGNAAETCGGGWRANVYTLPGTVLTKRKLRLLS